MRRSWGGQGVWTTAQENHKLLYITLEMLVSTTDKKQLDNLDPSGSIASKGRFVGPTVKDIKISPWQTFQDPTILPATSDSDNMFC